MTKRRNIIILIIAILCGFVGVYAVMNYVGTVKTVYNDKPMGTVIVCAQNIPENVRISREMLQITNIETEYILQGTFSKPEEIVDWMTKTPMFKGEQVLKDRISKGGKPGEFSYGIPEGKRAVSIAIDAIKGVSGLIRPGDRVDVLGTFEIPDDNSGSARGEATATDGSRTVNVTVEVSWAEELKFFQKVAQKLLEGRRIISFDGKNITFSLFQNIEVLAVGDKVSNTPPKEGIVRETDDGGDKSAKVITFCLDPEQAELITNMEKVGTIKLDLRNPGDDEIRDLKPILEYKVK